MRGRRKGRREGGGLPAIGLDGSKAKPTSGRREGVRAAARFSRVHAEGGLAGTHTHTHAWEEEEEEGIPRRERGKIPPRTHAADKVLPLTYCI